MEKLFLDSFLKKSKLSISLINILKFIYFVFIICQVEDYRNWFKLSCRPLVFTSSKAFLKSKRRSGTSLPASFSAWLLKEHISLVIFFYLTKAQCLVALTLSDIGQYVYCNSLLTRLWRNNFEINLIFLTSRFFYMTKKSRQRILRTLEN